MIISKELSAQVFYILLALSIKPRHGYEIMKQVKDDSEGKVRLGPGTLYGAIKRLSEEKVIAEVKIDKYVSQRRRYYQLTGKGKSVLRLELERYEQMLRLAEKWRILHFAI